MVHVVKRGHTEVVEVRPVLSHVVPVLGRLRLVGRPQEVSGSADAGGRAWRPSGASSSSREPGPCNLTGHGGSVRRSTRWRLNRGTFRLPQQRQSIFKFFSPLKLPTTHHLFTSFSSPYSLSLLKKMEDVFEGAVGIDLGTTYSYVACWNLAGGTLIDLGNLDVSVSGKMTVSKSSPTTVSLPAVSF